MKYKSIWMKKDRKGVIYATMTCICHKCNKEVQSNFTYCPSCGTKLTPIPSTIPNSEILKMLNDKYLKKK